MSDNTREKLTLSPKDRPKRIPLHEQRRDILTAPRKPGFVRRIINDVGNRVSNFLTAGYRIVEDKNIFLGEGVDNNQSLGSGARKGVGRGVTGVLVEIPEELYKEDQAAKQREIDEREKAMQRNLNSGQGGTYGEVEIKSTK